jgi:hypothetical protein
MERKSSELLGDRYRKNVRPAPSSRAFGLWEVVSYLAAIVVVAGSVISGWNLNLFIALIMLMVLSGILRDVGTFASLPNRNDDTLSSGTAISSQRGLRDASPQSTTRLISLQRHETPKPEESTGRGAGPVIPLSGKDKA